MLHYPIADAQIRGTGLEGPRRRFDESELVDQFVDGAGFVDIDADYPRARASERRKLAPKRCGLVKDASPAAANIDNDRRRCKEGSHPGVEGDRSVDVAEPTVLALGIVALEEIMHVQLYGR